MSVPVINLTLDKGTNFETSFFVTNLDNSVFVLNNYSAIAKIRKYPTDVKSESFQTTITSATGEIKVSMASTITSLLTSGRNYYDVVLKESPSGKITKVFEGMILVNDTVSV